MSCYQINGGTPLRGRLAVQGAKNSVLPILAAALLAPRRERDPQLSGPVRRDRYPGHPAPAGLRGEQGGDTVALDARELDGTVIPASLMGELRSSVIFLGALLTRMGEVELSYPGGCELGPRPIDLHLGALRQLGRRSGRRGQPPVPAGKGDAGAGAVPLPAQRGGHREHPAGRLWLSWPDHSGGGRPGAGDRRPSGVPEGHGCTGGGGGDAGHLHRGGLPLHPAEHTVIGDQIAAATYLCAVGAAGGRDRDHGSGPGPPDSGALRTPGGGLPGGDRGGEIRLTCYSPLRAIRPVRTAPTRASPPMPRPSSWPPWPAGLGALCLWRTSSPAVTTM